MPLSYPAVALEDGTLMIPRLLCHLDPDPVCPHYMERPGTHSIPLQDIQTLFPVQGIIDRVDVNEDGNKDPLPHGNYLV